MYVSSIDNTIRQLTYTKHDYLKPVVCRIHQKISDSDRSKTWTNERSTIPWPLVEIRPQLI